HVHALLSPRFENRMAVHLSPVRIQRIRERWEKEVLVGLQRQERRIDRARQAPDPRPRQPERDGARPHGLVPSRMKPRPHGQLELFAPTRRALRVARDNVYVTQWLRFGRRRARWQENPERAARRAVFRLATRAMPAPLREVLSLTRGLRDLGSRLR